MKKIIAAAVATAFVAPAFAADITVGGSMAYQYVMSDKDATSDSIKSNDNNIAISASSELNNGMTVTATMKIVSDSGSADETIDNQGQNLAIAGDAIGKLSIGDASGALDSTGDWTDKAPYFGGFGMDGQDAALAWTLPTFVSGLTVTLSNSPKGVNVVSSEGDGTKGEAEATGSDSIAATYDFGNGLAVYYGTEDYDQTSARKVETKAYGVKYSTGPIYVAIESGYALNTAASTALGTTDNDDLDYNGIAVTYAMGDLTLGAEMQETKDRTASQGTQKHNDETVVFGTYSLGDASVFVSHSSDGSNVTANKIDQTAVGISYAF